MTSFPIVFVSVSLLFTIISLIAVILTTDKNYKKHPQLFNRTAYKAWKTAFNGKLYAVPTECDSYEHFVEFGEWWGYVHVENSPLILLLYRNTIEYDNKMRVAIFNTDEKGTFDPNNLLFTHFWEKHGDKLVEKAMPLIVENYKKQRE